MLLVTEAMEAFDVLLRADKTSNDPSHRSMPESMLIMPTPTGKRGEGCRRRVRVTVRVTLRLWV